MFTAFTFINVYEDILLTILLNKLAIFINNLHSSLFSEFTYLKQKQGYASHSTSPINESYLIESYNETYKTY